MRAIDRTLLKSPGNEVELLRNISNINEVYCIKLCAYGHYCYSALARRAYYHNCVISEVFRKKLKLISTRRDIFGLITR